MDWIFGLVAVAAVVGVVWDSFVRGRRGVALSVSVAAMIVLVGAGVARGADVSGPWPLVGLVVGGALFLVAESMGANPDDPT
jgi:hypothetical protein